MTAHRGNRHGRSEEARLSILEAADDLLVERGYAQLTIEGIAARAGVAKQTIYRWWQSKTDVLLEAFTTDAREALSPPDTGELVTDLRLHLRGLALFLTEHDAGAVFRALHGEAQHDATLAARLRTEHLSRQRELDRSPLERAVARGDLPAGLDLDLLVDTLVGPIYYRVLVSGDPVGAEFTDRLVDEALRGLRSTDPREAG
ncbi:AcrR family transcriptional regulator [Catenuloplanes nepalensis]|uniref:AcrR family transcriptional regulator n=1 Tax=Catenuloplanes nepalensis TaxID=587533 RepID=A0ABT9N698_9ACTN|nr:TetR/AcrR family transcriptional regulator [Catenuloplanes nepalensis]MDP9799213.1 AcrR family transcriptional regulator [Catenuloplanes nepalensis]